MRKNILFFALALLAVACTEKSPVREPSPAGPECGVYFLPADKANNVNLPVATVNASDVDYIYYIGRTNNQGELTVPIINESDPCFQVPSSVTFRNGDYTAEVIITFSEVPAEDTPVIISIDPSYSSPYSAGTSTLNVVLNCLWEDLGIGQWFDSFSIGDVIPVNVLKSKVAPLRYRVFNAYTKEIYEDEDWFDASLLPEFLEFTILDPIDDFQLVTWNKFFYIGLNYQGVEGQPIKAYLPSAFSSSQAENDENSFVYPGFDGKLLQIVPYFYIDGLGGYGLQQCFLSLPGGPDLNELLGE